MSRPLRIAYPGAWYHVMNRGRRREEIFTGPQDYQLFLEVLKEAAEIFHLHVAAYCLMPNHYHLLIHTPEGNVSRCMRHVNGVYTQRFNRRYKADGQLFRGRYKALLVDADSYLLELLRYIHRNPLQAGLVENLDEYEYSSHKAYISNVAKWSWLHKDYVLSMFSAKKRQAVKAYKEFVAQEEPQEIGDFFSLKNMPSIIGTKEFKEWVRDRFHDLGLNREISGSKVLAPDPDDIKAAVGAIYKVSKKTLEKSKRGFRNMPKDVAIYLVRRHSNETLANIGKYFNMVNYSSVSSAIERVKAMLSKDKSLRDQVAKIEKTLNKSQRQT